MSILVNLKQLKKESLNLKIDQEKLPELKCRDKKRMKHKQNRTIKKYEIVLTGITYMQNTLGNNN